MVRRKTLSSSMSKTLFIAMAACGESVVDIPTFAR